MIAAASTRPLVSALVATHNHAPFIRRAVESVLAQDHRPLEIVLTDDGSTDGTREIVEQLAAEHPEIVLAPGSGSKIGIVGNCQRGLQACSGEYVAICDGDDEMLPGKLSRQVAWFEADEARVLCGHRVEVIEVTEDGERCVDSAYPPTLAEGSGAARFVRYGPLFPSASVMVRASALPPWGYDERLRLMLDGKLWIDVTAGGGSYGHVPGTLARYRRHPGNLTRLTERELEMRQEHMADNLIAIAQVEARHPGLLREARAARSKFLYAFGVWWIDRGSRKTARAYFAAALREGGWTRPRVWGGLAMATVPERLSAPVVAVIRSRRRSL